MHRRFLMIIALVTAIATLQGGILPAFAASSAPVMRHSESVPTSQAIMRQKSIPFAELNSQKNLHGVYGLAASTPKPNKRPDDSRFTAFSPLRALLTRLIDRDSKLENSPTDGTSPNGEIKNLTLTWTNDGSSGATDKVDTWQNTPLNFQARIDFTVQGNNDHAPGSIQFELPLSIFKDSHGQPADGLNMSVPQDPSPGSVWTYRRIGSNIFISNTQTVPATDQGYFEFTYTGVTPSAVVSGQKSTLTVSAIVQDGDTTSTKTSNTLEALINTHEKIDNVHKQGDVSSDKPDYTNFEPAGFNQSNYWYVNWYMSAHVTGNRAFSLNIKDEPSEEKGKTGIIIGTDIPGATPEDIKNGVLTVPNAFTGYVDGSDGDNFYYHVTMAYPRSELGKIDTSKNTGSLPVVVATVYNKATYTLTPQAGGADDDQGATTETSADGTATESYQRYPYWVRGDNFNIYKHSPSEYDAKSGSQDQYDPDNVPEVPDEYRGENAYGLNRLSSGKDFHAEWNVTAKQFNWHNTFGTTHPQTPNGKIVKSVITDEGQWFDPQNTKDGKTESPLSSSEGEINSLTFRMPIVYSVTGSPDTGYDYEVDDKLAAPDATIEACQSICTPTGTTGWKDVATVSYKNGSVQVGNPQNGASVDAQAPALLKLPSGTTMWRATYSTKNAGESWSVDENVTIHPSGRVADRVKALLDNSRNAATLLDNKVRFDFETPGSTKTENYVVGEDEQYVRSAWQEASMEKNGWQTGNDTSHQTMRLHYSMTASAETGLPNNDVFNQLVQSGVFNRDNSGRFYDLLPGGVRPDLSSVTASGGTVTDVRLVEDWRHSGRQMLIVSVQGMPSEEYHSPGIEDRRSLEFDASYSWADMKARGNVQANVAAYVSDSKELGTVPGWQSEPEVLDPTHYRNDGTKAALTGVESLMTNLEHQNDGKVSVLYASTGTSITLTGDTSATRGLDKQVASENGGDWSGTSGTKVLEGGSYRYRFTATGTGDTTSIIFADNLEDYKPAGVTTSNWKGTLLDIDTSALKAQDIAPVVWYRTSPFDTSRAPTLSVSDGWTQAKPGDMSRVKAVAVDCSKKADGSDYVPPNGQALEVELLMRAPYGAAAGSVPAGGKATYNDVWMSSKVDGRAQRPEHSYTKVTLVPFSVRVVKTWDDDDDRDALRPKSVKVTLTRNGISTDKSATLQPAKDSTKNDGGSYTFTNLPAADENGNTISYGATDSVRGYTASAIAANSGDCYTATSASDKQCLATVRLTNTHVPATVSLSGVKTWQGGTAPSSLTLHLWSDDGSSAGLVDTGRTKRVSPVAGSWSWTWPGLYRYRNVGGKAVPVKYAVSEAAPEGWKPVDDKGNQLDASHLYPADQKTGSTGRMVNVWHPFGDLSLTKSVTDAQGPARDATFTFTLGLTRLDGSPDPGVYRWVKKGGVCDTTPTDSSCSGQVSNGQTVTLKAGQTVTVREVPMGERYVWTETAVKGFHTGAVLNGSGVVKANATAAATVENVYRSQGFGYVKAVKSLVGRPLHALQFGFTLRPVTGVGENGAGGTVGDIVGQAWNEADGSVDFPAIAYSQADAGKTFWYQLVETSYDRPGYTSDHTVYRVKMTVVDKGDGTMGVTPTYYTYDPVKQQLAPTDAQGSTPPTFKNVYKATGTLRLAVQKVFVGGSLADKHFTFHLSGGGLDEDSPQTDSSGVTWFDIPYTEKQAYTGSTNGRTFSYTIREKNDGDKTIVWDSHSETVTVKVTDNGDGTLSMDETYADTVGDTPLVWRNKAGNGSLRITKYLATDAQTQAHKDTDFPMRIYLTAPAGGTLPTTLTVMFHKADTDHNSTAGNVSTPWTVKLNKDKTSGTVDVKVHGNSWIQLNGIPGGASYQVVEEDN